VISAALIVAAPTAPAVAQAEEPAARVEWVDGHAQGNHCADAGSGGAVDARLTLRAAAAGDEVARSVTGFARADTDGTWSISLEPPSMVDVTGAESTLWELQATCTLSASSFRYDPWQAAIAVDGGPTQGLTNVGEGSESDPNALVYVSGGIVLGASALLLFLLARQRRTG